MSPYDGFFNPQVLINAFDFLHYFQILSVFIVQGLGIMLFGGGLMALSMEGDERSHSRFFKRGYGYGAAMIISGLCLTIIVEFVSMFVDTFAASPQQDPLMMLRMDGDDIVSFSILKLGQFVVAAWLSLTAYFFLVAGFFMFVKASHRMDGGAMQAGKYWLSSLILFLSADYMRNANFL